MIEIKPPNQYQPGIYPYPSDFLIFLVGSIEMGTAIDWQTTISQHLIDFAITILNPHRDDWDSSWEQRKSNPQFYGQVEWELNYLSRADLILMYFVPDTKLPISLLELGLYANSHKLFVACPDEFWRKGNIEMICERYRIPLFLGLPSLLDFTKQYLRALGIKEDQQCH